MFYNPREEKTFLIMTKTPGYIKLKTDKLSPEKLFMAIKKKKSKKQVTNCKKYLQHTSQRATLSPICKDLLRIIKTD